MQHLDERTIHSWLDGALSADEAARVEAHVKECPQCAAAVAEARGFIAASSRILTALDNAPRGVIPVAAPRKRIDPLVWRIAATVMIVAAGTLVVVRNRGVSERSMSAMSDSATLAAQSGSAASAPMTTEPTTVGSAGSGKGEAGSAKFGLSKKVAQNPSRSDVPARDNAALPEVATERGDRRAAMGGVASAVGAAGAGVPAPAAPLAVRSLNRAVEMDAAADLSPLKVVGTPRRIGAKVTLYEVAPGDTVTLTEPIDAQLGSIVVTTGIAAAQPTAQAAAGKAAVKRAAPTAAAPDSQVARAPAAQSLRGSVTGAPASRVEVVDGVTTISWMDPTSGHVLQLSGRISEARLQQIRTIIERERAAPAAAKKNP
jgi:hypothetical protein